MAPALTLNTPESWTQARTLAKLIGEIPSSFASTIRALLLDNEKRGGEISTGTTFLLTRLLKGPSVYAPLYYATLTFHEDKIKGMPQVSAEFIAKLYDPMEMGALLGMTYLYRRAKRLVEDEEWQYIDVPLQTQAELGAHLGIHMPAIGLAQGLFAGAMRNIAFAAFQKSDKKAFTAYRRHLKTKNLRFDDELEMLSWDCTSTQIASVLIQTLGFGVSFADCFTRGLSSPLEEFSKMESDVFRFAITRLWFDSLLKNGTVPDIKHRGAFYPSPEGLTKLLAASNIIRKSGSVHHWLARKKDDLDSGSAQETEDDASAEQDAEQDGEQEE